MDTRDERRDHGPRLGRDVEPQGEIPGSKTFGAYLRAVREGRRLSLDAVEEMSQGFPERVTKSHLSRIENGLAYPTFTRLFALSRIYGVPIASMAERFDLALQREMTPLDLRVRTPREALEDARKLVTSGRHAEALALLSAVLDERRARAVEPAEAETLVDLRLWYVDCLLHLGRYECAKAEAEELLGQPGVAPSRRLMTLEAFVISCYRLGRYTVAIMALEQAFRDLEKSEAPPKTAADLEAIRGNVLTASGRTEEALSAYRRALGLYEAIPHPFEACRIRINIGSALAASGEREEASRALEQALAEAEAAGYDKLRSSALSALAAAAFEAGDQAAAEAYALRSNTVARPREYLSIVFRNCYYLWKIARARRDEAAVRANERTLRAYVGRIEEQMPEAEAFRAFSSGGEA